jgi:hypothetical protein
MAASFTGPRFRRQVLHVHHRQCKIQSSSRAPARRPIYRVLSRRRKQYSLRNVYSNTFNPPIAFIGLSGGILALSIDWCSSSISVSGEYFAALSIYIHRLTWLKILLRRKREESPKQISVAIRTFPIVAISLMLILGFRDLPTCWFGCIIWDMMY